MFKTKFANSTAGFKTVKWFCWLTADPPKNNRRMVDASIFSLSMPLFTFKFQCQSIIGKNVFNALLGPKNWQWKRRLASYEEENSSLPLLKYTLIWKVIFQILLQVTPLQPGSVYNLKLPNNSCHNNFKIETAAFTSSFVLYSTLLISNTN